MKRINLVEILKDCPKGMELDCTLFDNVVLSRIDLDSECDYPIRIETKGGCLMDLTRYGTYTNEEEAKCLIFPKGKTTWKGFVPPCQFKDGDIIYNRDIRATAIFYKQTEDSTISHCFLNVIGQLKICHYHSKFLYDWNLATEEEKEKLFNAIKADGYHWSEETKTLERLIEPVFKVGDKIKQIKNGNIYEIVKILSNYYIVKYLGSDIMISFNKQDEYELVPDKFDINTLKQFDKVLVRTKGFTPVWTIDFYDGYQPNIGGSFTPFGVTGGKYFQQCIPYEGNEHLRGTTNDCDERFKTWEK